MLTGALLLLVRRRYFSGVSQAKVLRYAREIVERGLQARAFPPCAHHAPRMPGRCILQPRTPRLSPYGSCALNDAHAWPCANMET
jgi:hypothetical protein